MEINYDSTFKVTIIMGVIIIVAEDMDMVVTDTATAGKF